MIGHGLEFRRHRIEETLVDQFPASFVLFALLHEVLLDEVDRFLLTLPFSEILDHFQLLELVVLVPPHYLPQRVALRAFLIFQQFLREIEMSGRGVC